MTGSIDVIIRNNQGSVIASLSQQLSQAYRAEEIKTLAATRALELGLELGLEKAVLEGDSELIIKALALEDVFLCSFDSRCKFFLLNIFLNYFTLILRENVTKLLIIWLGFPKM